MAFETKLSHLLLRDFLTLLKAPFQSFRLDPQSRSVRRSPDVSEEMLERAENLPFPVLADGPEQSMFNRIIFRAPRRIVADGDGQSESVAQPLLKMLLPSAGTAAIAPARIRKDQQMGFTRIRLSPVFLPPSSDGFHRELRRVRRVPHEDRSLVARKVVDPIRNRASEGILEEVVDVHSKGFPPPRRSGVLERADQLLLLGVHADDRPSQLSERLDLCPKIEKLSVAFGMSRVRLLLFPMTSQRIVPLSQQPTDRRPTHSMTRFGQGGAQRTEAATGPFRRLGRRSGGLRFDFRFQGNPY